MISSLKLGRLVKFRRFMINLMAVMLLLHIKRNNCLNSLNLHLRILMKVQDYEENEFHKLIKEKQYKTKKPNDTVDASKELCKIPIFINIDKVEILERVLTQY